MEVHARERGRRFWTHLRSPITLRSVVFVLALFFCGYAVFSEISARRRQEERAQQIERLADDSRQSLENTRAILINVDARSREGQLLTEYMQQMNASLRSISEALKAEPPKASKEKARAKARPPKRRKNLQTCLRETERVMPFGEQKLVERVLTPVPCRD